MKADIIVISVYLRLSTLFAVSYFLSVKVFPKWKLSLGFGIQKKSPFNGGSRYKIMWTFCVCVPWKIKEYCPKGEVSLYLQSQDSNSRFNMFLYCLYSKAYFSFCCWNWRPYFHDVRVAQQLGRNILLAVYMNTRSQHKIHRCIGEIILILKWIT